MDLMKKWKWSKLAAAVAVAALGICLIVWPDVSAEIVCCLCGAVLLVVGALRIVSYFRRGISVLWHRYELPLGLLDALLGGYFLARPSKVFSVLPVIVGIAVVVDGLFQLQASLELREAGVRRWWGLLIVSLVNILFAALLILDPFTGGRALMIGIGAALVIDGVQDMIFIHYAAKAVREGTFVEIEDFPRE